jgi:predicted regulator of Ras-like GTPase activity (Roadblock/LC7/MglB family)
VVPSPFAQILEELVRALPGALGAIFVDWEGEAVDSFSRASREDIRLEGAHWGVIYNQAKLFCDKLSLGRAAEVILRFDQQQVIISRVTDGYIAIITLGDDANLGRALGMLRQAKAKLREEM